ncbi:hypothetical protein DMN91_010969 [Ooceraea biroi]|uniref:Uncharacterized protein n=1 Tax=Ooceraea biroi TaxID=2015173 RepID=A0A3L8D8P9_OOCBI|nr:uncharacterized protein LOC105288217 [Ooceraea biroi]RLU16900.1 hypothetical protein DMN91_010969 [Ooceraea biroi]
MLRSVPSHALLHLLLQLCAMMSLNALRTNSFPDHYLELAKLDIDEIEIYLSKLDFTDVPTVKMMIAGFKCPISALPFGALKSDWSRLVLLEEAQPEGSIIKQKLVQLMRILIIAYYQMEERFDVISRDTQASKKCLREVPTTASTANETSTPRGLNDSYLANEISSNNWSNYNCSKINPSAARTTTKSCSSFNDTVIPPNASSHQNVTSSTDLNTRVKPRYSNATFSTVGSKILGNCMKHPSKDSVRKRSKGAHNKIYENLKNKARYSLVTRGGNEVYVRNRTRISPATNEFWRYVTLPPPAPFSIPNVARAYRAQRLNASRTNLRKSRKRASLDTTLYGASACSHDVDRNKEDARKHASSSSDTSTEPTGKT